MTVNQQTIEQRLAEFTEVHGTVLLGMHRELQSQLKKVDDRLEAGAQALGAEADRSREDLARRARELDARYKGITAELRVVEAAGQDREAGLRQAMESHSERMDDCVQKVGEVAEGAQRAISELVERARSEWQTDIAEEPERSDELAPVLAAELVEYIWRILIGLADEFSNSRIERFRESES